MSSEPPVERPVGPGNPPKEHRWKKGCPSPNPAGRPCKAQKVRMLKKPEAFDEMFLRMGAKVARTVQGEEITLAEAVMRRLYEVALDTERPNLKAMQFLVDLQRAVSAENDKMRSEAAQAAWKYKEHEKNRLEIARKTRRPIKDPIPHPDDIIVTSDLRIQFVGPCTEEEHATMVQLREYLEQVERLIPGQVKARTRDAIRLLRKFRTAWLGISPALPPRLRKHWPGPSLREMREWKKAASG